MIDDSIWKISRDENTATTNMHRARRSADVTEEALSKRTDGVSADKHKRSVCKCTSQNIVMRALTIESTVVPTKNDSDDMFCLQLLSRH